MKNLAGSGHCVQELPVNIVTYGVQDRWTIFTEKGGVGPYFSYLVVMWYKMIIEKDVYLVSDTGDSEKNPSSPNRSQTYDLLVTSPDAPPLSHRRLVGATAIKLGSCDKRPAYC